MQLQKQNIMPEIRFYHLQNQQQAQVFPSLLAKAVERGYRVIVKLRDEKEVEQINDHLWTFAPDSFLPHGSKKDGKAEMQTIWLTSEDENPNNAKMLILGQGVETSMQEGFDLCCEMLDGLNEEALAAARKRWKNYKKTGYTVTYWQQTERGGWEQKV